MTYEVDGTEVGSLFVDTWSEKVPGVAGLTTLGIVNVTESPAPTPLLKKLMIVVFVGLWQATFRLPVSLSAGLVWSINVAFPAPQKLVPFGAAIVISGDVWAMPSVATNEIA